MVEKKQFQRQSAPDILKVIRIPWTEQVLQLLDSATEPGQYSTYDLQ